MKKFIKIIGGSFVRDTHVVAYDVGDDRVQLCVETPRGELAYGYLSPIISTKELADLEKKWRMGFFAYTDARVTMNALEWLDPNGWRGTGE